MRLPVILLLVFSLISSLQAQDQTSSSPIIFIYDASGSMWGQVDGKTKMEIAASVLSESIDQLPDHQQLGLVAYGHRSKGDCRDVEFLVAVAEGTQAQVKQSLAGIKPLGKTPLAYSATQVIDQLRTSKMAATIILVTDGIESCDGNICEVIKAAKAEGIDFRLHIIGFGLKADETEQLICAAQAGGGQYYDAANAGGLSEVLTEATAATVDQPAGNFSVFAVKNGVPVDAYVKAYKAGSDISVATARTYADTTLLYLPAGAYDLRVRPLENSDVNAVTVYNLQSLPDEVVHQTVSFDGGKIELNTFNNGQDWDAVVKILEKESNKNVAGGRTYGRTDIYELNPGVYDVEVRAMIIEGLENVYRLENVEVKANETKALAHNFASGIAMIGANSSGGLVDATVKIVEVNTKKNVAGGRTYTSAANNPKKFILTPGVYQVTLNGLKDHRGKTEIFELTIEAGETIEKVVAF